jgi:hypothetical protein
LESYVNVASKSNEQKNLRDKNIFSCRLEVWIRGSIRNTGLNHLFFFTASTSQIPIGFNVTCLVSCCPEPVLAVQQHRLSDSGQNNQGSLPCSSVINISSITVYAGQNNFVIAAFSVGDKSSVGISHFSERN